MQNKSSLVVLARAYGEEKNIVKKNRLGVIGNNSTDNSAGNQTSNKLIITTAVMMVFFPSGRRWWLAMTNVSAIIMAGIAWSRRMFYIVRGFLVSFTRTYTVRGCFTLARATVMVAA